MGFFALAQIDLQPRWVERGQAFLRNLESSRCRDFRHFCWGYPFDWETCCGTFPAGTPLITTVPYWMHYR